MTSSSRLHFVLFKSLFIHERHRQREKQAPCGEPDAGLDPGTPRSRPGPKADAQPLSPPRAPALTPSLLVPGYLAEKKKSRSGHSCLPSTCSNEELKILSNQEEWFKAELGSQEGYVPKNFIDIQFPEWFHEGLSRHQAENLLMGKEVGFFIIRASQSSPGDFSISVRHEDDVQHFKVMRDNKGNYFLWTEKFPSLNKLVDYYRTTSISKQKQIFLRDRTREDQGHRGNSLDRRPQGGLLLSGAVGEEIRPPMTRKLSDHPTPPPSQYPPAPPAQQHRYLQHPHFHQERRGGSLDINDGHCGVGAGSEMNAALMHRRHTDPVQLQVAGRVRWARALYDFEALEDDELGFRSGEVVEVLDSSNPSWWTGRLHNKLGLFPANYVAPMIR